MKSHYSDAPIETQAQRHTLSVLVDNEPGVLARIAGLFSGRGYNIESLTVSETEHEQHVSRITIVTTGTAMVIDQIKHQLDRLVPVHRVVDLTITGDAVERELALVKVVGKGDQRSEALRIAAANLVLMGFNLLPAFPMDGGRVLRALLAMRLGRAKATHFAASIGQVLAFGIGFMGLFGNPLLLVIAAFVFIAAGAEADGAALHDAARDLTLGEAMITEFSALHPSDTVGVSVERLIRSSDDVFPVIDESGRAFGVVTRNDILSALTDTADATPISAVMQPIEKSLEEAEPLETALRIFESGTAPALIVTRRDQSMAGLVTRASIAQVMLVRTARPGWRVHRGGLIAASLPGLRHGKRPSQS